MLRKVRRWHERPTSWPEPSGVIVIISSLMVNWGDGDGRWGRMGNGEGWGRRVRCKVTL